MIYVASGRRRPQEGALAHDHILHGKNTTNRVNSFRYFWIADR
jgi:hypothetical protein